MIVFKKTCFVIFALLLTCTTLSAQLNMTYVGSTTYTESLNDIWGYTDSSGNEYALVGARNGVSVVDLTTPSNPTQVGYAPGDPSVWRDIKVWGDFAYATCDQGDDGLMIIDLSNLPNGITYSFWRPELTVASGSDTLERAHNIWIDENGVAYISGANIGNRGVIMLDVATTPGTPIFLGAEDVQYAHDCYARGDTLYTADIYGGYFSVYDVSNKANPVLLGTQTTPNLFTHNLWLSDDGKTIFSTDEKADAFVGSYDVSDPSNMSELDRFRPDSTLGAGVIPHNVHVWDDFLIISYYTDGCILVDASRPHNLIEVGNFDTYFPANSGFNGAWGAYPYFPSGLIAVSDIGNGLYILQPNYVRACYLEGQITDASNGNPINAASVVINTTLVNESSDINGDYATGFATFGTYTVTYSASGYASKTETVNLSNGVLTVKNIQLQPLQAFTLTGTVAEAASGNMIDGAVVEIFNNDFSFSVSSDASGNFSVNGFYPGDYTIAAGKWGYKTTGTNLQTINLNGSVNFSLELGYEDDFAVDLGWKIGGSATSGQWERAEPEIVNGGGQLGQTQPDFDIQTDLSDKCYITGNSAGNQVGSNDVDNGSVILTSPSFDVSNYSDPYISYYTWFVNGGGQGNPNDQLDVKIISGGQTVTIESISQSNNAWNPKKTIRISDFIAPSNDMELVFQTSDLMNSGHIVEAAVDVVVVFDSIQTNTNVVLEENVELNIYPNPSNDQFTIDYQIDNSYSVGQIQVYNMLGQLMETTDIQLTKGQATIGENLGDGIYVVQFVLDGQVYSQNKVIKQ